ncbi:unnamed protein product [Acanthoscelides obtectus]|uniref:Uncharacterized protein n=1 Tax=Acanthoscelides obtectus TaxID=200917 RepID=A0A9P0M114_ACAOB|nr:unnamed protein product [Acanthoscelides obtectus]CAK1674153.1 hypothetical protein AOBTE_LOCUS29544 [Acanthoscelides obtectus]
MSSITPHTSSLRAFNCLWLAQIKVFLREIRINLVVLQRPIIEFTALCMVRWLEFLRQLNLVRMQARIFCQNWLQNGSDKV